MSQSGQEYGFNVVANGRNWNCLRLLTGFGAEREGHKLTAIDIRFKEATILVVLKKDSPKGPQVAFLEAANLDDVLFVVASAVKSKTIPWKPDKFRSMRSDKT
jgi:hypothetical protein